MLTSTMSSKHSYARSGERGEKREDGQQGERKSGERRGTWGKESEQTIRQNTGDRRGDPIGTRGEGKERRGERRAKREQSRTERRQVRGEKREKVRRRRRAPRDDLRERTEKVKQPAGTCCKRSARPASGGGRQGGAWRAGAVQKQVFLNTKPRREVARYVTA